MEPPCPAFTRDAPACNVSWSSESTLPYGVSVAFQALFCGSLALAILAFGQRIISFKVPPFRNGSKLLSTTWFTLISNMCFLVAWVFNLGMGRPGSDEPYPAEVQAVIVTLLCVALGLMYHTVGLLLHIIFIVLNKTIAAHSPESSLAQKLRKTNHFGFFAALLYMGPLYAGPVFGLVAYAVGNSGAGSASVMIIYRVTAGLLVVPTAIIFCMALFFGLPFARQMVETYELPGAAQPDDRVRKNMEKIKRLGRHQMAINRFLICLSVIVAPCLVLFSAFEALDYFGVWYSWNFFVCLSMLGLNWMLLL